MKKLKKILHVQGISYKFNIFLVNKVYVGTNPKYFEKKRKLLNKIGFNIGENTKIVGPIYCDSKLTIGKNCWIGKNLIINGNGSVLIGNNCDIAPEVSFQTGGHQIGSKHRRAGKGKSYSIIIRDGCWIGARSTILGGVTIDNGVVVASCACITKSIGESVLVGGVPGKVIKKLDDDKKNI